MFQKLVNSIPDSTIFFVTIGGCMLYPISAPIFIFTAMMVSCCKSPNFLDDEYQMNGNIRELLLDGEINNNDIDNESDINNEDEHIMNNEPQNTDDLVMEIDKLKREINKLKNADLDEEEVNGLVNEEEVDGLVNEKEVNVDELVNEEEVNVDELVEENNKNNQSKKND